MSDHVIWSYILFILWDTKILVDHILTCLEQGMITIIYCNIQYQLTLVDTDTYNSIPPQDQLTVVGTNTTNSSLQDQLTLVDTTWVTR